MQSAFPGPSSARSLGILLILSVACSAPIPKASATCLTASSLDEDGVQRLFPSAQGSSFRLGAGNPNTIPHFVIEKDTLATPGVEGKLPFWRLPSHRLTYASGGQGWTSRLHIRVGGTSGQRYTWKTQRGYLFNQGDLKNQEFTVFLRVHGIMAAAKAQVTLKTRGGAHTASDPEQASCAMLTLSPASHGGLTRFGKELTHPIYDYKTLAPLFPATLQENVWVGLKLVTWNDPQDAARVIHRLYLDTEPFDPTTGAPRNGWRLFSEYVDVEGVDTGHYNKLVDWGGWQTTLRTDGFDRIDFALISAREISPPQRRWIVVVPGQDRPSIPSVLE